MESQRGGTKKRGDKEEKPQYGYLLPPWPEWNDAEINAEKWDPGSAGGSKSGERRKGTATDHLPGFVNPLGHGDLPNSLKVSKWVRSNEYKPDVNFTVYDGKVEPNTDLVTPNKHLLQSQIIRALISSVANLLRLAFKKPFSVELESPLFVPTGDKIWQPWHHIYSHCKAGKGQYHNPIVNPNGKYIVRLYYMGSWRRITVDDYLPLDESGRLLLPTTSSGTELWFIILSKAILLIGALSWTEESEVVDFNVTTCLTGWLNYNVNCRGMCLKYIWLICQKLLMADHEDETLRYDGVIQEEFVDNYCFTVSPKISETLSEHNTLGEHEVMGSVVIFGNLTDLSGSSDTMEGLSPCYQHLIMITEAKNIKFNYDPDRPPTPLWKKFRWKEWALKNGLIQYKPLLEVKSIRVFSSLKKLIVPKSTTSETSRSGAEKEEMIREKVSDTENKHEKVEPVSKIQEKARKKGKSKEKSSKKDIVEKTSKSEKRSKTSEEKRSKATGINLVQLEETPEELDSMEPWFDLEKLIPSLSHLEIFYRPSCFTNTLRITDVSQLLSKAKSMPGKRQQTKDPEIDTSIRKCKNDCFYLFVDSIYCKKIFISFSILPDCRMSKFLQKIQLLSLNLNVEISDDMIIMGEDFTRYHILGQDYNWKAVEIGKEIFSMSSKGTNSIMLQLNEGISVIQIWLKVPFHYSVQIMSQIPFLASSLEEIQENLVGYSSSLLYYGEEMRTSFINLCKTNSESLEYFEALKQFRSKYLPICMQNEINKPKNDTAIAIDEKFEEALLSVLQEQISDLVKLRNVVLDLQNTLMNPSFGNCLLQDIAYKLEENRRTSMDSFPEARRSTADRDKKSSKEDSNMTNVISEEKQKKSPRQATKKPSKKDKSLVSSAAENSAIYYLNSRENFIKILLRLFELDRKLIQYYYFKTDLNMMLVYSDYSSTEQVALTQDWLPLLRFVINFHSKTSVLIAFNFDSSVPSNTFRIINNDTMEEMPHSLLDVAPAYYVRNNKGYTLLGYAYLKEMKLSEATWKLRILAEKQEDLPHSCTEEDAANCRILQPPKLFYQEIKGYYIPNKSNNICRCILKAINKKFITLRLRLSDIMVECVLKIKKESSDDFNVEYRGRGEIIIPVMELDTNQESDLNKMMEFEIEVYVLKKNGWPISEEEKSEIHSIKQQIYRAPVRQTNEQQNTPSKRKSDKKLGREKSVSIVTNAPIWKLQVLTDVEPSAQVSLEIDTRELETIRKLKASWEDADPGRRERAEKIREQYLLQCGDSTRSEIDSIIKQKSTFGMEDFRMIPIFSEYFSSKLRLDDYVLLDDCLQDREDQRQKEFEEFNEKNNFFIEKRKFFLEEQSKRCEAFTKNFESERSISAEIMNISHQMREEYIQKQLSLIEQKKKQIGENKKELKKGLKKGKEDKGGKELKRDKTKKKSKK